MIKAILIVMWFGTITGPKMETVEFASMEACNTASQTLADQYNQRNAEVIAHANAEEANNPSVHYMSKGFAVPTLVCVWK